MAKQKVVIIIEDDADWLEELHRSVSSLGYNVEPFESFDAGKRRLMGEVPYHLVVTDVFEDPIEDAEGKGLKFAEYVSNVKKVPVIVVSGMSDRFIVKKAFKDGHVADFVFKGKFDSMEFAQTVKSAVEKYSLSESTESEEDENYDSKTFHVGNGGALVVLDGNNQIKGNISLTINSPPQQLDKKIEDLFQLFSERLAGIIKNYDENVKAGLNKMMGRMNELGDDRQKFFSDIVTQMTKLAKTNDLAKAYLKQLAVSESSGNEEFLKRKVELSIALIPGILKLKTDLDLDSTLKKAGEKYNEVTLKAYEKLSDLYSLFGGRLNF